MAKLITLLGITAMLFCACADGSAIVLSQDKDTSKLPSINLISQTDVMTDNIPDPSETSAAIASVCPDAASCTPKLPSFVRKLDPDQLLALTAGIKTSLDATKTQTMDIDPCLSGGAITVQCIELTGDTE